MNTFFLRLSPCLLITSMLACTQAPPLPPGATTYSPYTPQQINEFNRQSLSPVEGPFGPVAPNVSELDLAKQRALNAKYYNQPDGEAEAEALETQSFDPYQATKPVLTF